MAPAAAAPADTDPLLTRTRWTPRRISATAFAATATAALGILLFGRGGGGRSHAVTLDPSTVAAVAAPKSALATAADPTAVVGPVAPVAAPTVAAAPAPSPEAEARGLAPAALVEPPARRPGRSRSRAERDRIARGLSIDPFAEAARRGGR